MTVREFVEEWLATRKPEVKPGTIKVYRRVMDELLEALGEKAKGEICDVTQRDIVAFRAARGAALSGKSTNHELSCVRMLFRAAKRDGLIADDPAEFVEQVRSTPTVARRAFTVDELRAILKAAGKEWRSMIVFGLYTGQRLGDIASLTWANIDTEHDEIRLVTQKTNRVIVLPIAAPLRRHIEALPAGDIPAAPIHPEALEIMTRAGRSTPLSNQFAAILSAVGMRPKRQKGESSPMGRRYELSFHSLRATATTMLHEAGIPASVAQAVIGHDSEAVHSGYIKVGRGALSKAVDAFPDVL